MRISLHRRRHMSLPPRKRRSPKVLVLFIALTTGTMAFAASRLGRDRAPPAADPRVTAVDDETLALADERIHAHLKKLER